MEKDRVYPVLPVFLIDHYGSYSEQIENYAKAYADPLLDEIERQREVIRIASQLLNRYLNETPLGHQPYMIADKAVASIAAMQGVLEMEKKE